MRVSAIDILQRITPYQGNAVKHIDNQSTKNIMDDVLKKHNKSKADYDNFCEMFWRNNAYDTCRELFNFCKRQVPYKEERDKSQTVKSPAAIIMEGYKMGGDCKHYASFINGVVDALARKGYPIVGRYRFACYGKDKNPGHVFAVVEGKNGKEIFVDPVLSHIDQRRPYYNAYKDEKLSPMKSTIGALYEINGIGGTGNAAGDWMGEASIGSNSNFVLKSGQPQVAIGRPFAQWFDKHGQKKEWDKWLRETHPGMDAGAWMGNAPFTLSSGQPQVVGKLKIRLPKIKLPKIQPGKIALKLTLIAPRNAFLGLLKLNVFSMATDIWNKTKGTGPNWDKISKRWQDIGGDGNKLHTAVTQGVAHYNSMHPAHKVTGIGLVLDAGVASILAIASPIIALMKGVLNSLGVKTSGAVDAVSEGVNALSQLHNDGTPDANGNVTTQVPAGTIITAATKVIDAAGKPTGKTEIHAHFEPKDKNLKDKGNGKVPPYAADQGSDVLQHLDNSISPSSVANAPAVIYPTSSDGTVAIPAGGTVNISHEADNILSSVENFVTSHKKELFIGGGVIVGGSMILKALSGPKRSKTQNLVLGAGIAAAGVYFGEKQ